MKLFKIPYSDNYYIDKFCTIYKEENDILTKVKNTGCNLYKLHFRGNTLIHSTTQIIAITRLGYCPFNKFNLDYDKLNVFNTIQYVIESIKEVGDSHILINDILFASHPRWRHLYSNKFGAIFDLKTMKFRYQTQDKDSYMRFTPEHGVTHYAAHRFVFECWNQRVMKSTEVIHHINSKKQENYIWNLEATTAAQNSRYSILQHERKLDRVFTEEEIEKMCKLMQDGKSYFEIAKEFGIDSKKDRKEYKNFRSRLSLLRLNKLAWRDISEKYDLSNYEGYKDPAIRFSTEDIFKMHQLRKSGMKVKDIAEYFKTTPKYVSAVLSGKKRHNDYIRFVKSSTTIERILYREIYKGITE